MTHHASDLKRVAIGALKPYSKNARTHSKKQVRQIAASIEKFGFTNPILIDADNVILAGHGRVEAAKLLGLEDVPVICLSHLSDAEKRAYIIADNRLAETAGWNKEILAEELQALISLDFDMPAIGFEPGELDLVLSDSDDAKTSGPTDKEDVFPAPTDRAVTRAGELWVLGRHRLLCGDAQDAEAHAALMQGEAADVLFTDPPYNVPVAGHVRTGAGHREFAMASGEMSQAEFEAFLKACFHPAAAHCRDGAVAFVCMDWRHLLETQQAGNACIGRLLNLCVWAKTNGGMGSLYRSQHELVFVFKKGEAPHCNHVELGRFGRNRTNVWTYAGVNSFKAARGDELAMHPTVKPTALVEDALKDVSKRNDLVLDPFGGSGTTLIAAEKSGRRARLIEIDPLYCDVIIRRFETYTGKQAVLAESEETFEDAEERRQAPE